MATNGVNPERKKGFTLVELLIVLTIISILASLSISYYQNYRKKSILTSHALPVVNACAKDIIAYCIGLNLDSPQSIDISSLNLQNCKKNLVLSSDLNLNLSGTFTCNPGGSVSDGKVEARLASVDNYKAVCYLEDNALRCQIEKQ